MPLTISHVSKAFDRHAAVADVSLEVSDGEFLALLGPSGSGKTTLLRMLAGLETPDAGEVTLDGADFLALSPRERRIGLVFQHYALFRHMSVAKNIAFGLDVRPRSTRPSRAEIAARVEELLRLVQLSGLGDRFPAQLSGGQRQRVALARALAIEPRLLLLDEPFGALDTQVRRELRRWLRHVHEETGVTTVFVTHDQEEALDLADRVAILKDGRLQQIGPSQEVYERPATAFVHGFLGPSVSLPGDVTGDRITVFGWTTAAPDGAKPGPAEICVRPDRITLEEEGDGIEVACVALLRRGAIARVEVRLPDGREIELDFPSDAAPAAAQPGRSLRLRFQGAEVFPPA